MELLSYEHVDYLVPLLLAIILPFMASVSVGTPTPWLFVMPMLVLIKMYDNILIDEAAREEWGKLNPANQLVWEDYALCRKPSPFVERSRVECSNQLIEYAQNKKLEITGDEILSAIEEYSDMASSLGQNMAKVFFKDEEKTE